MRRGPFVFQETVDSGQQTASTSGADAPEASPSRIHEAPAPERLKPPPTSVFPPKAEGSGDVDKLDKLCILMGIYLVNFMGQRER
jgi:hypothetical protein